VTRDLAGATRFLSINPATTRGAETLATCIARYQSVC